MSTNKMSRKKKVLIGVFLAIVILFSFLTRYLLEYSAATRLEIDQVINTAQGFTVKQVSEYTHIIPDLPTGTGIVFYPGGKVDEKAYIPLLSKLAQNGISIVIVKMPFHLAVFNTNAATDAMVSMPQIANWYIAGHSLGGSMACVYASKNDFRIKGVILLAAYSTVDLSQTNLRVISIYGTVDHVLDMKNIEKYKTNLPATTETSTITGGNHGYFGNYGEQKGDGEATISREEQQFQAARMILEFLS